MVKYRFEKEVLDLTRKILNEYNNRIAAQKLRFEVIGPKSVKDDESYTSEIEILFFNNGTMIDILEFFVFRHGKPIEGLDKIKNWLYDSIEDVLSKNKNI